MTRLRYDQAEELSTALRTDSPTFLGGTVSAGLAYIPHYPEVEDGVLARIEGELTEDLRNATHIMRTDIQAMRDIGDALRAHMPHRLEPIPSDPAASWTPTPVN
ncbi:hypothetical protein [Amycolatopsis sp. NPDC004625]|uniref:hypothetical protein n=1 Tax=Amycolatopsis sp. NPDC004625 TaxID=3154670 RepID=UPI0033A79C87